MFRNIKNGLRLFTFRNPLDRSFSDSARMALSAVFIYLILRLLDLMIYAWPIGGYEFWSIPYFLAILFIEFGILLAILSVFALGRGIAQTIIAYAFAMSVFSLLNTAFSFVPTHSFDPTNTLLVSLAVITLIFAARLPKFVAGASWKLSLSLFFGITASVVVQAPFANHALIFYSTSSYQTAENAEEKYAPVDAEAIYYAQPALMAAELAKLLPSAGDANPRLFTITGAGTAHQRVFLREVRAIPGIVSEAFGDNATHIQLANSRTEPMAFPLTNSYNLEAAFSAVSDAMNPDQDIALTYLTSHGAPDLFSLSFYEAGTKDLTSIQLADMLDRTGLSNVIFVLSACYSGSFIDELAAPDRVIITASDHDSQSFGCSDTSEWTWFGDAFFNHALRANADFIKAFETSRNLVSQWEEDAGFEPSNPQINIGSDMPILLENLRAKTQSQS